MKEYPMIGDGNRGYALVINNRKFDKQKTRAGSEVDEKNIIQQLEKLKLEVNF